MKLLDDRQCDFVGIENFDLCINSHRIYWHPERSFIWERLRLMQS